MMTVCFACGVLLCFLLLPINYLSASFTCKNGVTISSRQFCNGEQDCDGTDEIAGNASYPIVSCKRSSSNLTCQIHRDYICNSTVSCLGLNPCDVGCPTHYKCSKTQKCAARSTLCDGNPCNGCPEDDDDWMSGIGFQCVRNGRFCLLPQQLLWDSVQDCAESADVCFKTSLSNDGRDIRNLPGTVFDDEKCFKCLDGSMIVPRRKVCDGTIDCSDLSDECLCERRKASICDHVQMRSAAGNGRCVPGQIYCASSPNTKQCLNSTSVCNGVAECFDNTDEKRTYCRGTLPCDKGRPSDTGARCRCKMDDCRNFLSVPGWPRSVYGKLCDGVADCPTAPGVHWLDPPGFPEDECEATCSGKKFQCGLDLKTGISINPPKIVSCTVLATINGTRQPVLQELHNNKICNGRKDCVGGRDEIKCPYRFPCKSKGKVSISIEKKCDGTEDCDNGEDEMNCTNRIYCLSLNATKVSIPKNSWCNSIIECDDMSDELNCSDGRFYCESKKPLFVMRKMVLDGHGDCSDWSDECSKHIQTAVTILSSRYELIANTFLRAIVWIMAVLALLGNGIVVVGEVKHLWNLHKKGGSASLRTNHMLVLNLAVADLLMGIYLLTLGIAGAVYSGTFCSRRLEWLTSKTCVAMGILVVLSSQTSVFTMILLTVSRLYGVFNPIESKSKPRFLWVIISIIVVWCLSLTLALVPLTSYYQGSFTEAALIDNNPLFGNVMVDFAAAKNLTRKLVTFSSDFSHLPNSVFDQIQAMTSWSQLQNFMAEHSPNSNFLSIKSYFGYYSASSSCIPNLFVTRADKSWPFSLSISIINFLSFIFVACGYTMILLRARSGPGGKLHRTDKKTTDIQRKIIRLIGTDFCCWIPLSMMVFVNFSGVEIHRVAYAVAAILLLPINSALNPILYSNYIDKLYHKIKKKHEAHVPPSNTQTN